VLLQLDDVQPDSRPQAAERLLGASLEQALGAATNPHPCRSDLIGNNEEAEVGHPSR
jgi:hypothetical protein